MPAENRPHGILLIEEYGALGVAISSALRKFAPHHRVEAARSFAEALSAAARMRPELFVIDLDPPPLGEIDFLTSLKANYPDARTLIIATGSSPALRNGGDTAGALQFIQKPFDLADFGAAVQALVGPWNGGTNRGALRDLGVLDVVHLKCLAGSNGVVRLERAEGPSGEIHFQKGQILHAASGMLAGLPALEEMLTWKEAKFREGENPDETPRSIQTPWEPALLQALRRRAERRRRDALASPPTPAAPPPRNGPKLLVIDDTEMLLVFVADVLGTADQSFQVTTAASGSEGVKLAVEIRPDLILLDYSLADMTGDKVCAALLAEPATARIPILMMSGHLTELNRTAQDFANVVAALPKPFLSGALLNAVAKALSNGPLPEALVPAPPQPPEPQPEPAPPPPDPPPNEPKVLPVVEPKPASIEIPAPAPPPPVAHVTPEPAPSAPPPFPARTGVATFSKQMDLNVTIALEVVSLQMSPTLQTDGMRLQPIDRTVGVKMKDDGGGLASALESGFSLGPFQLSANGKIETLRLVPTRRTVLLPATASSFAIAQATFRPSELHAHLELIAAARQSMRVQLCAPFELIRVELSARFEIEAVFLRARGTRVIVRNSGIEEGIPFELEEVELDPAGELRQLLVRAMG